MLMKFNEKAISLACPLGKVPSEVRRRGLSASQLIYRNSSVCSQSSQPPSLSGKIYQTCGRLIFANLFNFYMLPARELASPQAMTEGCACDKLGLSVRELASPKAMTEGWRKKTKE